MLSVDVSHVRYVSSHVQPLSGISTVVDRPPLRPCVGQSSCSENCRKNFDWLDCIEMVLLLINDYCKFHSVQDAIFALVS